MASMSFSPIGNFISTAIVAVSDNPGSIHKGFPAFWSSNVNVSSKRNVRDLIVTHVATPTTPLPTVAPSWEKDSAGNRMTHVAWTSVRQERWEGELIVEGEIPLWLVRE